ncbi:MAG: hypothetical protein FJ280_23615 [Planctomycetes bacterium]|nr:hypothetical protein [Planctomycetota bacterium]
MSKHKSQRDDLSAVRRTASSRPAETHSAAGSAAGFTYQFGRAIWWLATKPGSFSVAIETLDDVFVESADGSAVLEQDKYSTRDIGQHVSDRAVALWKTLANWLGMFAGGNRDYACLLVTNRPVPSDSLIRRISDTHAQDAVNAVVAELREIAAQPTETIRPYAEAVRSAPRDVLATLVLAIRLASSDSANTEWEGLREEALDALHVPSSLHAHGPSLLDEVLGWLVDCCMQAWRRGVPAKITSQAFNNAFHRAIDRRRRQYSRERPPAKVPLTAEDLKGQATSTYVKQLDLIHAQQNELDNAICDCLRYGKEVLRLTNTGEYTGQDWKAFEDELEQRWERIFARLQRLNASEEESQRGYRTFHETTDDYRARLQGQETDHQYFSAGAYHRLADQLDVGWHPRFRELLTDGGRDGSEI